MSKESSTPATKSPWVISTKLKTFGNIHERALEELRNVGQEIERTDPGVSELLTYLEKSEQTTQSLCSLPVQGPIPAAGLPPAAPLRCLRR